MFKYNCNGIPFLFHSYMVLFSTQIRILYDIELKSLNDEAKPKMSENYNNNNLSIELLYKWAMNRFLA